MPEERLPLTAWTYMLGGQVKYCNANGVRTRYLEAGEGKPPLILLHGGGGHAEAYLKNMLPLAEHFNVYAIDSIGHGLTDKPDIDYTILDIADHVRGFMDAVGIEKACISGESMGGWAAAWVAIRNPERVVKLILNTSAGFQDVDSPQIKRLRELSVAAISNPTRETVRKRLEFLMYDPKKVTDELVEIRYRIYSQPDTQRALAKIMDYASSEACRDHLLTPDKLRRITVPTLFLWTRQDPTIPWQVAEKAHKEMPGSQFCLMEECGHWPQWEKPEEFNKIHVDFLRA